MGRHRVDGSTDHIFTDSELMSKAQRDAEAFAVLYQRYVTRVYRYFLSHVGHTADAEDLTSQPLSLSCRD
jgi:hypothetical protein